MYHPAIIASTVAAFERRWKCTLVEHSAAEIQEMSARIDSSRDKEGNAVRALDKAEQAFIQNELLMCKASFPYYGSRYCQIRHRDSIVAPMFPLLESQQFVLDRVAQIEKSNADNRSNNGIIVNVLKGARQVGISTLTQGAFSHRVNTQNNIFGLIAGDDPAQSAYLFGILERIIDSLPWWMKLEITDHVKNTEIRTSGGSHVWVGSGKSTRGVSGQRGQLGRGKSLSLCHCSELSTWETADQIDGSLIPTIARYDLALVVFESTAKGRGDWWQQHWRASKSNIGRFKNVFLPWYVERETYSIQAPIDWSPSDETLAHAKRCEETSEQWVGSRINITRAQLYWYETTRAYYESKGKLKTFLEEYGAADDEECFQHAGYSVFTPQAIEAVKDRARQLEAVVEISNTRVSPDLMAKVSEEVWKEWEQGSKQFFNHLLVWESPRKSHEYILAVDVSEGMGQDRSVIDVIRIGNLNEPDEQVAQFITDDIDATFLANYVDVIGHFYCDDSDIEALAMIEINGPGGKTQAELQGHYGYSNFWRWQYVDSNDPNRRFSQRIGWVTTSRTRSFIMTALVHAVNSHIKTVDGKIVRNEYPEVLVNSPITIGEMYDLQSPGPIWAAEASPGAHDDTMITLGMGIHGAQTVHYDENEPLSETRRRVSEEKRERTKQEERDKVRHEAINTDTTAEEQQGYANFYEEGNRTWF